VVNNLRVRMRRGDAIIVTSFSIIIIFLYIILMGGCGHSNEEKIILSRSNDPYSLNDDAEDQMTDGMNEIQYGAINTSRALSNVEMKTLDDKSMIRNGGNLMNQNPRTVNQSEVDFSTYFSEVEIRLTRIILLAGVMKCGTGPMTTLLSRHPDVRETVDLQVYLTYNFGVQWYLKRLPTTVKGKSDWLFSRCTNCFAIKKAPALVNVIREITGKRFKMLFIVRNPIDRVISHYTQLISDNATVATFGKWVQEILVNPYNSSLLQKSRYVEHFESWYSLFEENDMLIIDHKEFVKTPWLVMQKVENYLSLVSYFTEDKFMLSQNSQYYCIKTKGEMDACSQNLDHKGRTHITVSEQDRKLLRDYFHVYNERLFKLLNRRFDWD
ncbi:unnamed protein product, partial [Owenia fusiformis]